MNDHSGKGRIRSPCASLIGHVNSYRRGEEGPGGAYAAAALDRTPNNRLKNWSLAGIGRYFLWRDTLDLPQRD
ncbi:hypothetical protein Q8A67_008458 [Cirrhinus molitorella]|uniref:Uncharacterized protein n=1 Tax=Cirrhinus molitorella TaxID=172907 RepID=A0AA88PXE3_9TELE|nr:hypothetical protein Q8A67_008458 [Cirrhinus molitorella]